MKAYVFYNDENKRALMVIDNDGLVFEESISGWNYCIDLCYGIAQWKHKDGRTYADWIAS